MREQKLNLAFFVVVEPYYLGMTKSKQ